MTPVLYIGLGSSGLRMLEEAQRFFYSTNKTCCPDHVRFLFIETDASKRATPVPGQPHGRPAIEGFHTVLEGVGDTIDRLHRSVKAEVVSTDSPPDDAVVIVSVKDRHIERLPLKDSRLPESLYESMSYIFSASDHRVAEETAFRHLKDWLNAAGVAEGKIAVRLRGDRLEVFIPTALNERNQLRVEMLFNDIELITRLEKDKSSGRESKVVRWLPTKETVQFADAGAGGMRSVGRIALWGKSTKGGGRYLPNFRSKVKTLIQELRPLAQGRDPIVYIAGTFAGGTNSGMFIDVAYLCRDAIDPAHKKNPPVLGLFLLPEVDSGDIKSVSNAYACLNDLDHFTTKESQFLARWPLDVAVDPFERGTTPFKMATLMSLSWVPDHNLDTLYRMSGLFLYLMGAGFMDYRKARAVDISVSNNLSIADDKDADEKNFWKFSAVGLTGLFYPRGEVRVCAACSCASRRILASWLDSQHCEGVEQEGATIGTVYAERWPGYRKVLDSAIEAAFQRLGNNGPGGRPSSTEFQKYLDKAAKGEAEYDAESLRAYLSESGSIFEAARSFASPDSPRKLPDEEKSWTAIEVIRAAVDRLVSKEIDETGNLNYGLRVLEGIADYLGGVVDLWESLSVAEWDAALEGAGDSSGSGLLAALMSGDRALFGIRKEVRRARFEEVLRLLFIHHMTPHVKRLRQELLSEQKVEEGAMRFPGLCNMAELNQLAKMIRKASETVEEERKLVLQGIRPNALIKYVYPAGSFEAEVEAAVRSFFATGGASKHRSMGREVVRHLGKDSTLAALRECQGRPEWLAGVAIDTVTALFEEASLPQPAATADNSHYLYDSADLPAFAEKAISDISVQMGRRADTLDNAPTHPKVVVTDTQASAQRVVNALANRQIHDFDATQSLAAVSSLLQDMVLFFDERPVTKLQDLASLPLWRPHYDRRRIAENSLDTYFHT